MTQPSSDKLITDAMIEAGVKALEACRFHETGDEKKAAEIYRAMEAARPLADGDMPPQHPYPEDYGQHLVTLPECAIQLRDYQQQLDPHGEMVGVSRQAVDETLEALTKALQHKEEAERERDEVAWLIERPGSHPYWSLEEAEHPPRHWTADHNLAVRFARKIDAVAVIARINVTDAIAVEHMWVKS